eukprot:365751-Chlamydomonas_euryale.AAC.4
MPGYLKARHSPPHLQPPQLVTLSVDVQHVGRQPIAATHTWRRARRRDPTRRGRAGRAAPAMTGARRDAGAAGR